MAIEVADIDDVAAALPPFLPGFSVTSTSSSLLLPFSHSLTHLMLLQRQQSPYKHGMEEILSNQKYLVLY